MENPEPTLGFLLHDVARLLRRRFEQNARDLGLTRSQWQVLVHLEQNQGIQQSALAEILEVEPITLVRILDKLQAAKLIERRPHPNDRRAWMLHLRPCAHTVLSEIKQVGMQTRTEALQGLSEPDRKRLLDILTVMKTNLQEVINDTCNARSMRHG